MNFTYDITKKLAADVVVVGGGTAGVFAAIAAARTGAQTILLEKNNMLGGTMTVAKVTYPGLFFAWGKQIIAGPCWESIQMSSDLGGAQIPEITYHPKEHWREQINLNRFIYTAVLSQMCCDAGVRVITNSMLSAVYENEAGVRIIATEKTGLFQIEAKNVIDATGDANVSVIAGYKVEKADIQQPATPQNRITGYNIANVDTNDIKDAFKTAGFPEYLTPENLIHYLRISKIDIHVPCSDADTSDGRTKLEQDTLRLLMRVYKFYRSIKGLEKLTVDFIAEETGVRESNRIIGESTITADDYINGATYPDSVCYAFYPIDLHIMTGIIQKYHEEDIVAKVPYSALIPKNAKHILCAGRCISSDVYANSAVRVEAVCMATGQAAGCAAAIAAENGCGVKDVDYTAICNALKSIGAIVPEE